MSVLRVEEIIKKEKAFLSIERKASTFVSRGEKTRTSDPLHPMQVR
jgi:hypothetical protein